jgi:arylsulfatase A-like enzyme
MDALDTAALWDDTMVVVCTDHGHYLGEKDVFGKPAVPVYNPLGHVPLLIWWPGSQPARHQALTTAVDLHATLADLFGVTVAHRTHGRSLLPVMEGGDATGRDWLLTGVWGREVHFVDGEVKYARAPEGDNAPLAVWSNRWSTMPVHGRDVRMPDPDDRAWLDRMPGSTVPVIHQPFTAGDPVPYWALGRFGGNHLYRLADDPAEEDNRAGTSAEKQAADKLREILRQVEAPDEQLARLGLS